MTSWEYTGKVLVLVDVKKKLKEKNKPVIQKQDRIVPLSSGASHRAYPGYV